MSLLATNNIYLSFVYSSLTLVVVDVYFNIFRVIYKTIFQGSVQKGLSQQTKLIFEIMESLVFNSSTFNCRYCSFLFHIPFNASYCFVIGAFHYTSEFEGEP